MIATPRRNIVRGVNGDDRIKASAANDRAMSWEKISVFMEERVTMFSMATRVKIVSMEAKALIDLC